MGWTRFLADFARSWCSGAIDPNDRGRSGYRKTGVRFAGFRFRRSRHTASAYSSGCDSLIVTHPFHPLAGQRVSILFERRYKSAIGHVYVCEGGPSGTMTLPEDFTDRGTPSDTRLLTVEVLVDLAAVVSALRLMLDKRCREY